MRRQRLRWTLLLTVALAHAVGARQVTDDEGLSVTVGAARPRIVSLSPGATALLFAAGAGGQIVGTSDFSDEPEAAARIPRIGDSQRFDLERIAALHPDAVVVWSGGINQARVQQLNRLGLPVYRHRLERLDDLPADVRRMGALAGTTAAADAAAVGLEARIAALRRTHSAPAPATVLLQVWDQPLYALGHPQLLSDGLRACGYRNVFDDLTEPAPAVGVEAVIARDPDFILAIGEPVAAAGWLERWRAFGDLKAVREQHLVAVTDRALTKMGPAALGALESLCRRLMRLDAPPSGSPY
jgi:iron complex transport system substrate-binding protein